MGHGLQASVLEAPTAGEGGSCRLEQVVLIISVLKTSSEIGLNLLSLLFKIEPWVCDLVPTFCQTLSLVARRRGTWREKTCPVLAVQPWAGGSASLSLASSIWGGKNSGTYHVNGMINARLNTYRVHGTTLQEGQLCPLPSAMSSGARVDGSTFFLQPAALHSRSYLTLHREGGPEKLQSLSKVTADNK